MVMPFDTNTHRPPMIKALWSQSIHLMIAPKWLSIQRMAYPTVHRMLQMHQEVRASKGWPRKGPKEAIRKVVSRLCLFLEFGCKCQCNVHVDASYRCNLAFEVVITSNTEQRLTKAVGQKDQWVHSVRHLNLNMADPSLNLQPKPVTVSACSR